MFSKTLLTLIRNTTAFGFKRSVSNLPKGLNLQVTKNEEIEEALDFLVSSFIRDEPIIQAFAIEDTCDLQRYLKLVLQKSTVVKLVNDDCDIVAAAICSSVDVKDTEFMRTFADCSVCDPKTKRLLSFLADVFDSQNLFECFKVKELWDISILATALEARGKGLSKLLAYESRLIGKKEGLPIVRMCCTSFFAAKMAKTMKFVTLPPRHSLTFRDKKGCPWLPKAPAHPHGNIVVAYDFLC